MGSEGTAKAILAKQLVDGTGKTLEDACVLVLGDTIREVGHRDQVALPQRTHVIDLGHRALTPGIVDAHMHFFGVPSDELHQLATESESYRALRAAGEARKMLEAGVTAARCLGSSIGPTLRRAVSDGHVPGPRIVAAGEFICSTGGTWDQARLPLEWIGATGMLVDGIEAMREIVRRRIREGANVIKIGLSKGEVDDKFHAWGDDPFRQAAVFGLDEIKELTREAHANKLKVSAHCIGDDAVRAALDGSVDIVEHGYAITEETRKRLVDSNMIVVTTLAQLWFYEKSLDEYYPGWLRPVIERHLAAMRTDFERGLEAGVRFALGTDLIGYPTHPQDKAAKEFELAVELGMDPMQALVAGTSISSETLSMERSIGTIEPGKLADIIAVPRDPINDIRTMQEVEFVMQGGEVIIDRTGQSNEQTASPQPNES